MNIVVTSKAVKHNVILNVFVGGFMMQGEFYEKPKFIENLF